jgi:hypothetical protein
LLLGALANDYKRQAGYEPNYPSEPTSFGGGNQYRYTTTGAVLGGIAGGIIGHNNGRKTAEGVAIGAASGAVLGVIADQSLQNRSSTYSSAPVSARTVPWGTEPVRYQHSHGTPAIIATPAVVTTPIASGYIPPTPTASAPIQAQTVIINNYYGSGPMAPANSLFGR